MTFKASYLEVLCLLKVLGLIILIKVKILVFVQFPIFCSYDKIAFIVIALDICTNCRKLNLPCYWRYIFLPPFTGGLGS